MVGAFAVWDIFLSMTGLSKALACAVPSGRKCISKILCCLSERVAYVATMGLVVLSILLSVGYVKNVLAQYQDKVTLNL